MRLASAIIFGFALCVVSCGAAADEIGQDEVLALRRSGQVMPLQDILTAVATRYPGLQVLEVELETEQGKYIYEIDILTRDNTVRELEVDAHSGMIVDDEPEN